eukprot:gene7627-28459_t
MGGDGKGGAKEFVIAGGVAGMVSRTVIAPVERAKIVFQVSSGQRSFRQLLGLFGELAKNEGVLSLWKGNSAAVTRVVPYLSTQFLCYEKYRRMLAGGDGGKPSKLVSLGAGSTAGVTAVAITYPLDVVRARMALQTEG